jgi:nucleoporin p58/p45
MHSFSELALTMRRLHDSFIALAGRLQTVHNSVETQKEQYLNLRKYFLKDSTNVFEEQAKKSFSGGVRPVVSSIKISPGPTPFSGNHIYVFLRMTIWYAMIIQIIFVFSNIQ